MGEFSWCSASQDDVNACSWKEACGQRSGSLQQKRLAARRTVIQKESLQQSTVEVCGSVTGHDAPCASTVGGSVTEHDYLKGHSATDGAGREKEKCIGAISQPQCYLKTTRW